MSSSAATKPRWQQAADHLVNTHLFQNVTAAIIVANAVVIGWSTFDVGPGTQYTLDLLDGVFLGMFTLELLIRLAAVGFRPRAFFGDHWNTFDFIVVAMGYLPGLSANVTALRLVRLSRIGRLLRRMPDLTVLLRGLHKASGPALSLVALTALMCYLYAIVGWIMFAGRTPEGMRPYFANLGEAMLTLFELLTLEGWNSVLHDLRDLHPLALPYVISFVLVGTYIVMNLVVGIIITSLDEAYAERDRVRRAQASEAAEAGSIAATIAQLKDAIADLEAHLGTNTSLDDDGRLRDGDLDPAKVGLTIKR